MPGSLPDCPGYGTRFVPDSRPLVERLKTRDSSRIRLRELIFAADAGKTELLMSGIDRGEVYHDCWSEWDRARAESVLSDFSSLPIQMNHPSPSDVLATARLKGEYEMAYADAFAASPAVKADSTNVPGYPDFLKLQRTSFISLEGWGK